MALSESGVVYSWGYNSSGQLGDGSRYNSSVLIVVGGDLKDKVVKQIGCGGYSSVALTEDGEVFTWGHNDYGRTGHGTDRECTLSPKIVKGLLTDQIIIRISCNGNSVFCLNCEGRVFAFGSNSCGTLGIGNTSHELSPVLTKLADHHRIQDVITGNGHTLALTDRGILLAWGANDCGQVGIGSTDNVTLPAQIKLIDGPDAQEVTKILAEGDTSYAVDTAGAVYVWGSVDGQNVLRPTVSEIGFPDPANEVRTPSHSDSKCCVVVSDLLESFDSKTTSDFIIAVEGKDIHVHKTILKIRSRYFETMFNNDWEETENGKIVVEHHSYDVYREFLRYIYSGFVQDLSPEENFRLLDLATMVLDDRLAEFCAKNIKKQVNIENLLRVFSLALSLQNKELVEYCVNWAAVSKRMKNVLASDAFKEIPVEHSRQFVLSCLANGGFD